MPERPKPTCDAIEEMELVVKVHERGLGTPRITIQRLKTWISEIRKRLETPLPADSR